MSATPLYIRWVLPIWPPLASVMHGRSVIQLVFRSVCTPYTVFNIEPITRVTLESGLPEVIQGKGAICYHKGIFF